MVQDYHAMEAQSSALTSALAKMAAIVFTAISGKDPLAVSPLSMTASVPSRTALATSVISALVGRALVTMLSNICMGSAGSFQQGHAVFVQHQIRKELLLPLTFPTGSLKMMTADTKL